MTEREPSLSTDTDASPEAPRDLGRLAMQGGMLLLGRQAISALLKLIGVLLIARVLGPEHYGAFVAAFGVYQYVLSVGQVGIGIYLLRHAREVTDEQYGTAYSILAFLALALVIVLEAGMGLVASWVNVEGFGEVMRVLVLAVPIQVLAVPAMARLERALDYKYVALVELLGQVAYYVAAIPLVMMGFGPVALAYSWGVLQAVSLILAHVFSRRLPVFSWNTHVAKDMMHYAISFSIANWIWQVRSLVNPMIVGAYLGAYAVGMVGMAIGLLEMLSVVKTIIWRLSIALLAKIQTDRERLRSATTQGMEVMTLAIGTIVLGFGWFGPVIIPLVFGERWLPVLDIYPYIAIGYLTNSLFNMHTAVLSVMGHTRQLAVYQAAHVVVFVASALLAVPQLSMLGYGLSEIAALPVYVLLHVMVLRLIGSPNYLVTLIWWIGIVVGLFWRDLGAWAIAVPFLALLYPISLRRLQDFYRIVMLRRKGANGTP